MESDTNTRKNKRARNRTGGRTGGLTLLILAVNIVPLIVLVVGLLSLGKYHENLINENLKALKERSRNFATAVAEGAVRPVEQGRPFLFAKPEEIEILIPELSRRMVRRLGEGEDARTTQIKLFDVDGLLLADSQKLTGPGGEVQIAPLEPPNDNLGLSEMMAYVGTELLELLPMKIDLQQYPKMEAGKESEFPDVIAAMETGNVSVTAWRTKDGHITLTAAAPVYKTNQTMGVILLINDGRDIETSMARVRFDVLTAALAALSITIFLSLYLAGVIGRPLKKLAIAAETVRQSKGREIDIPDFSRRRDEIGELSMALKDMTQALWDRMDTIERFAADVAHEIKNPLTSLRSAVETASKIKDPKDRDRLMAIIQHDVQRLDRLISDISNASRLDAELSREEMGEVDIAVLLKQLVDARKKPLERTGTDKSSSSNIELDIVTSAAIKVKGNEGRLAQVFENLISNALSFSPENGIVHVTAKLEGQHIKIEVTDEGPGIPENKLEDIFERFYTERPQHEDYGRHSGLGLSIAKQIISAHNGIIFAENLKDEEHNTKGARFTVILDAV